MPSGFEGEGAQRVRAGVGDDEVARGVERDREGHRARRLDVHHRGRRRSPKRPTPNTSMPLPLALVVTISWDPSGEKATWPGVLVNWLSFDGIARFRFRYDPGSGKQVAEEAHVALDAPAVQGVEHVDEVPVHGHAHREDAAGADDLAERELVAADREDRHGVAAGVHRVEQGVARVVGERALRGGVIHRRASELAADPAGVVGAGQRQGAVAGAVVGDDLVPATCCRFGRRPRGSRQSRKMARADRRRRRRPVPRRSTVPGWRLHRRRCGSVSSL